jgi:hypothetical protein
MTRQITTINLPHSVLEEVGHILAGAGFTLGTVGGGYGQMELDRAISEEEATDLTEQMGRVLFQFDVEDLDESE